MGLRYFKQKLWKEKETCLMSSTYFRDREIRKKQTLVSNFYAIGRLLHFLNFSDIFHMANRSITNIIVRSMEWGKIWNLKEI